jgi:hypothetical protein
MGDARNPLGLGGFQKGQAALNPGGRPRGASKVQLAALMYCLEAVKMAARIMRQPQKDDTVRLAAINTILDRGIGRPNASVNLDLTLNRPLESMSREELLDFRQRYAALMTASPTLIGELLDDDEKQPEPAELPLGLDPLESNEDG